MYSVAVKRGFIAQHFLIGGDWGAENQRHSHHYQLEVQIDGTELDKHGYLVDITQIESYLDQLVSHFSDQTLNELPEFKDLNPSIELFARILGQALHEAMQGVELPGVRQITVRLWEHENAWAAFRMER